MSTSLQRDFGRVGSKVELISEDVKQIKSDLKTIREELGARKAVRESDWKRMSIVAIVAAFVTHIIGWIKPFV